MRALALALLLFASACTVAPGTIDPLTFSDVLVCPWVPATEPFRLEGSAHGCWRVLVTPNTKALRYSPGASACDVDAGQASAVFAEGTVVQFWQRVGVDAETIQAVETACAMVRP